MAMTVGNYHKLTVTQTGKFSGVDGRCRSLTLGEFVPPEFAGYVFHVSGSSRLTEIRCKHNVCE